MAYVTVMNQLLWVFLFTAMEGREWILEMTYNLNCFTSGACLFVGRNTRVWRAAHGGYIAFAGLPRTQEGRSVSPERRRSGSKPLRVRKVIRFQHAESVCVYYGVKSTALQQLWSVGRMCYV